MSPLFNEHDSPWKRIALIFGWFVIGILALRVVGFLVTDVLPVFLILTIAFGPAVWVFWHAHTHGISRPFLWSLLALFTSVIGLLVYLLVNTGNGRRMTCSSCGSRIEKEFVVCPNCGTDLTAVQPTCTQCGAVSQSGWRYCATCGAALTKTAIGGDSPQ